MANRRKTTVLLIGNHLSSPKVNKNIWHFMAERLADRGWGVITTSSKEIRLIRLLDMAWQILWGRKQYDLAQIDVFSGRAFIWAEVCTALLKMLRKPTILILHGGRLPEFAAEHPRRVRRVLQAADVVVSPSPYHQVALRHFRSDIRFIPNPINLAESLYQPRVAPDPRLVWVRAFHAVYNPSLAVKVLHRLVADFPAIELLMVGPEKGDGSLARMLSLAEDLGVQDRVTITGGVAHKDIPQVLNKGDIFINTTDYDTAPRSVIEAMANGLCVVTTDVGGMPWLIDHGEDGWMVPPNDPAAMAEAVRRLLTDPGLAAKLSANARAKAERFDWSFIIPQWEAVFESLLPE